MEGRTCHLQPIYRNDVVPPEKNWPESGEWNVQSPSVGQRLTDDGIRRGNVGGGALAYRKKVDENSGYPHRSSIRALDKPSLKTPGEQSGLSILVLDARRQAYSSIRWRLGETFGSSCVSTIRETIGG